MARPDLPKVKIGHPVPVRFKAIPHRALDPLRVGNSVHQYPAGGAQQTPCPTADDRGSGQADQRVDEAPAQPPSQRQTGDRQNRSGRIRKDVDIG